MANIIKIGMADLGVAKSPNLLQTQALGSCIGIVLYDNKAKVGGMSHSMLPDTSVVKLSSHENRAKFATTAIDEMVVRMQKLGVESKFYQGKACGWSEHVSRYQE